MYDKIYIKKFIRDDGEIFEFDHEEHFLDEENTLLRRPDPDTTMIDYTEADGGEMIRQKNPTFEQEIRGIIRPLSPERYWTLEKELSKFWQINHNYTIVYVKKDGKLFKVEPAWISAGLQIPPTPHELYAKWTITLTVGSPLRREYAEDDSGKEIYANSIELPLLHAQQGGEYWDEIGVVWDELQAGGKNLYNKNDVTAGAVLQDGTFDPTREARTSNYIRVAPSTTYTISGRVGGWNVQGLYTENREFISRGTGDTFTTPSDCYYVRVMCTPRSVDALQLELGSEATPYEPFIPAGGGEVWLDGNGGVQEVEINSSTTIYPIWTVEGTCVNPSLQNNTTDTVATYHGTVANGQTLVVNFETGVTTLNGAIVTRNLEGLVSFRPDVNVIGFNSDGGNTETCLVEWSNVE